MLISTFLVYRLDDQLSTLNQPRHGGKLPRKWFSPRLTLLSHIGPQEPLSWTAWNVHAAIQLVVERGRERREPDSERIGPQRREYQPMQMHAGWKAVTGTKLCEAIVSHNLFLFPLLPNLIEFSVCCFFPKLTDAFANTLRCRCAIS